MQGRTDAAEEGETMAASAVRELITKIKFMTDGSGLEAAKRKIQDLKARMSSAAKQKLKIDVDVTKLEAARDKLNSLSGKLGSGGMMLSAAGAGMLGSIALPVKTAADFEATMSKVRAITGSTDDEMKRLTDTARQLGRDTVFSASEAGEAMTYLGMAGWKTEQIIAGMPGLLDLAAASGGDLARTADIISDDLTAFGMSADQAGHMADVFAAASTNANTNVELMGYTFKYVGAVCGALGYTIEDAAIATGMLANAGIKGEMAGTQLRSIMTRLITPTSEAAKALQELGVSATNEDGSVKPLRQTMDELRASFAGLTKEEQAQKAEALAGKEAMTGLLSIVNTAEADYRKLTGAIDNSDGAARQFAETAKNNLFGKLKELKSAAEEMAIELGNSLLPALSEIAGFVRTATNAISGFIKAHPKLTTVIMGTVAALGALFVGLGGLGMFAGGILQLAALFAELGAFLTPVVAGAGGLLAFLGPIAAGFAIVGSMIHFCTKYWDTLMIWMQPGLDALSEGVNYFTEAWEELTPVVGELSPLFWDIVDLVGGILVKALVALFNVGAYVFKGIGAFVKWLAGVISSLLGPISTVASGLSGLIDKAKTFLGFNLGEEANARVQSAVDTAAVKAAERRGSTFNQENTIVVNSTDQAVEAAEGFANEFDDG